MQNTGATGQTYRQLAEVLRRGGFEAGSRLPAERKLAERFGVSRVTLRNALQRLSEEGVLESVLGSGWFVAPRVVGEPPSVLQTFTEMAHARGLRATARLVDLQTRAASLVEAEQLRIAPAAQVIEIVRLRGMDDTVICLDTTVLPANLAEGLVDADLEDQSLYAQLEARCGIRIDRSSYSVRAEVADRRLAGQLQVKVGWPVLVGQEVGYAESGRPVLLGLSRYRGDSYRFQADLFRPR